MKRLPPDARCRRADPPHSRPLHWHIAWLLAIKAAALALLWYAFFHAEERQPMTAQTVERALLGRQNASSDPSNVLLP